MKITKKQLIEIILEELKVELGLLDEVTIGGVTSGQPRGRGRGPRRQSRYAQSRRQAAEEPTITQTRGSEAFSGAGMDVQDIGMGKKPSAHDVPDISGVDAPDPSPQSQQKMSQAAARKELRRLAGDPMLGKLGVPELQALMELIQTYLGALSNPGNQVAGSPEVARQRFMAQIEKVGPPEVAKPSLGQRVSRMFGRGAKAAE